MRERLGSAFAVFTTIEMWKASSAAFEKKVQLGTFVEEGGVIRGKNNDGSEFALTRIEADQWNRRVARLEKEAIARETGKDWSWFDWVVEYAGMTYETTLEQFDDRHTTTLQRALKTKANLAAGRKKGAEAKRKIGAKTRQRVIAEVQRSGKAQTVGDRHARRIIKKT